MKSFFKKHDLFKLATSFVFISIILSWIYSILYKNGVVSTSINAAGAFDVIPYSLTNIGYFIQIFALVAVVAGFYKFLGSINAYKNLTTKIATKFKGKEKLFVAIAICVTSLISCVAVENYIALVFAPFIISILAKMKTDKVTGLVASFGGILIGIVGSIFSSTIVGRLADPNYGLGINYGFGSWPTIIVFTLVVYALLVFFTFMRMDAVKKNKKAELLEDPFESKEDNKSSKNGVALAIVGCLTIVIILLAYMPWDAWGVTCFQDAYKSMMELTVGKDISIFGMIFGSLFNAFGNWDLFNVLVLFLFATVILQICYKVSIDKTLDEYSEGLNKIGSTVIVLLAVYTVLIISVLFPFITQIATNIIGETSNNMGTILATGTLTSIFAVDFQYVLVLIGSVIGNAGDANAVAFALQGTYGLIQFIAPTSVGLMIGLSMLNVKFKDYFKFIWKFALSLLALVIAVVAVIMYI